MAETIGIEEFRRIELRIATVTAAEAHPNADRLLVVRVDLGGEERRVVAGIRSHYRPEDLVGRQVVVVANLAPAMLRGVESQGMILAAADGDRMVILGPTDRVPSGAPVR
jgi:methionyl-tRNA synthetase